MRTIKFRGKRIGNLGFIEGDLLQTEIIEIFNKGFLYKVIPETVGQFIGKTDKNGKEIFEGDIVKHKDGKIAEVEYNENACCYDTNSCSLIFDIENGIDYSKIEVIGNIHDNPELLNK